MSVHAVIVANRLRKVTIDFHDQSGRAAEGVERAVENGGPVRPEQFVEDGLRLVRGDAERVAREGFRVAGGVRRGREAPEGVVGIEDGGAVGAGFGGEAAGRVVSAFRPAAGGKRGARRPAGRVVGAGDGRAVGVGLVGAEAGGGVEVPSGENRNEGNMTE